MLTNQYIWIFAIWSQMYAIDTYVHSAASEGEMSYTPLRITVSLTQILAKILFGAPRPLSFIFKAEVSLMYLDNNF